MTDREIICEHCGVDLGWHKCAEGTNPDTEGNNIPTPEAARQHAEGDWRELKRELKGCAEPVLDDPEWQRDQRMKAMLEECLGSIEYLVVFAQACDLAECPEYHLPKKLAKFIKEEFPS